MMELASEHAGEEVSFDRSREELVAILEKNGGHAEAAWGKGKLISEIFEAVAEEKLIQPTFVIDHPLEISPLAKKHPENPELTQRFELFILGHEYGNAFTELNDPVDQAERFRAQVAAKDMGDDEAMASTPTTSARWSTACRQPVAWASVSTAWSCCSPMQPVHSRRAAVPPHEGRGARGREAGVRD